MSDKVELRTASLKLRTELTRIAKELDEHCENCVIASVAGGAISAAGGVVAVFAGLAAGPVGVSVALAGSVAATSGSLVSGGARIANIVIDQVTAKRAQEKLDDFKKKYRQAIEDPSLGVTKEEILNLLTQIPRAGPLAKAVDVIAKGASASKSVVASASKSVVASASKSSVASASRIVVARASESVVASASTSVVASASEGVAASCSTTAKSSGMFAFWAGLSVGTKIAIVNLAVLPLTVADLALSSRELQKIRKEGKKSRAGDYIRDLTKALEDLERCCSEEIEREKIQALKEEREKMEELQRKKRQQEEEFEENQRKAKQKEKHRQEKARKDAEKLEEWRRRARQEEEERRERVRREKEELHKERQEIQREREKMQREREELQELRRQKLKAGKAKNTTIDKIEENK